MPAAMSVVRYQLNFESSQKLLYSGLSKSRRDEHEDDEGLEGFRSAKRIHNGASPSALIQFSTLLESD